MLRKARHRAGFRSLYRSRRLRHEMGRFIRVRRHKNAFPSGAAGEKHCALGSIKGNIGHVEPASGVASAIKIALSLHHKRFPATISKKKLNSFIDIEAKSHPLYIADRPLAFEQLRRRDEPIRAGVNS